MLKRKHEEKPVRFGEPAPPPPPLPLQDRIKTLHEEIDAILDAAAARLKAEFPSQPIQFLRSQLMRGCRCQSILTPTTTFKESE